MDSQTTAAHQQLRDTILDTKTDKTGNITNYLRAGAQDILTMRGDTLGWELLARHVDLPITATASEVIKMVKATASWLNLDLFMLGEATRLAAAQKEGRILVNLSPQVLSDPESHDKFLQQCRQSAKLVGMWRIGIEISERHNWPAKALDYVITELHKANCLAVIDDFPIHDGYSEYLKLPWDIVKVDCVETTIQDNLGVIDVLSHIENGWGKSYVIAEGVSTKADCQTLWEAGIDAVQSFALGPVKSADEIIDYQHPNHTYAQPEQSAASASSSSQGAAMQRGR